MDYTASSNLTRLMAYAEMSQKELAARIGVSAPAVSSWQRGLRAIPEGRIDAICEALDCLRSELLGGTAPAAPKVKAGPIIIVIAGRDYSAYPYILPHDRIRVRRLDEYDLTRSTLCAYSINGQRPRVAYLKEVPDGVLVSRINRPAFQDIVVPFEDIEIIGTVEKITRTVNRNVLPETGEKI